MRKWYSIKALAADAAEIAIFEEIGMWGVTAKDFIADLKKLSAKTITLSINSPGGSVFDALAIFNALRNSGAEITVRVMGIAASAASYIAMAGDKIVMPENTFMMVHNPIAGVYGNADDMRELADVLDKVGASLLATYVKRTGKPENEVAALLAAESYLSAAECVDLGLADEMEPALKIAAKIDPARIPQDALSKILALDAECFGSAVALSGDGKVLIVSEEGGEVYTYDWVVVDGVGGAWVLRASAVVTDPDAGNDEAGGEENATTDNATMSAPFADQVSALADAVQLGAYAPIWALSSDSLDVVKTRIADAREIEALCKVAKQPDAIAAFLRAGTPVAKVRETLIAKLAAEDEASHVDTAPQAKPATGTDKPAAINVADIYAARQRKS